MDLGDIKQINPVYDYDKVSGGYFEVYYDDTLRSDYKPFQLSFVSLLDHNVRNNANLFQYLKKTVTDTTTVSHAIYDLYDIGFPIDEWVADYMKILQASGDHQTLNTLTQLLNYIKDFGK